MNDIKPTLTVFTPTYNRADLLGRGYEALLRQTSSDFKWVIIDDGSTDNTKSLVDKWQKEGKIAIEYYYKENGGLHTGYNKAIEVMDTELCVCIDSDDYMPDDAVQTIISSWEKYNDGSIAGLVGLDYKIGGEPLGEEFPEGMRTHYIKLKEGKRYNFDNKIVLRVDLLKKVYPQPSFPGEKNFNPIWMMLKVDQMAPFVLINENLCFVDYQEGGMSYNLIKQYFNSPQSFLELRKLYIRLKYTGIKFKIKNHIHLVAQSRIAKKSAFANSNNWLITFFAYPVGILAYYYMRRVLKNFIAETNK